MRSSETCLVIEVRFLDVGAYDRERFEVVEWVAGEELRLSAIGVDSSRVEPPLCPEGLAELLARRQGDELARACCDLSDSHRV